MNTRELVRVRTLLLLSAWAVALGFSSARADVIEPEGGAEISLKVGDALSTYYQLSTDSATYCKVTGPGTLGILARLSFPSKSDQEASCSIKVHEGDRLVKSIDTVVTPSDGEWLNSTARPSDLIRLSVDVPDGDHRYRISLKSSLKTSAGVRYILSADKARGAKMPVYPIDMLEATSIGFKEKVLDFFLADSSRPVRVKVIGPTRLRVVTRLAYSGVMKGPQKYCAVIDTDFKYASREALETVKATTSYFTNHKEWSVGESSTFFVDVPSGSHIVSVSLGSSTAPALAVRFTVPKEGIRSATSN